MNKKGYFLVEAIVSITIVAIVITVIFANMSKSYVNENNEITKYNTTEGLYTAKEVRNTLKENLTSFSTNLSTNSYIDVTSNINAAERGALDVKKIFFTFYEVPSGLLNRNDIPVLVKQNLTKTSENENNCSYRYIILFNDNSYSSIGVKCSGEDYLLTVNPNGGIWEGKTTSTDFSQPEGTTKTISDPAATYSITYNANGQGATYTSSPTSITKPFDKWKLTGGGILTNKIYTFVKRNGVLTAKYKPNTFTLPNISKTGHTCKWAEESSSGTQYDGGTSRTISKNMTYYAKCAVNQYVLTVNPNTGTWNNSTSAQTFTQNYNTTKTIANPTRTGYTFDGWILSGSGSLSGTTFTYGAGDATLTAKWKVNQYTLTVNPNGGTWNNSTSSQNFTQNYNTTKTIANPTRTGYTFDGWTLSGKGSLSGTTFTYGAGNATLTAKWTANKYNLTVDANGGTLKLNDGNGERTSFKKQFTYGLDTGIAYSRADNTSNYYATDVSTGPLRTGYTFDGWKITTPPSGGGSIGKKSSSSGAVYFYYDGSYAGDVTVKAQWKINQYTLTVNPNGGTWNNSTSAQTFTQNYNTTKTIANPTRTGYTFDGWTLSGSGTLSGTTFTFGAGATTLTAKWIPLYVATFNGNGGTVSETSRTLLGGDELGTLPVATRIGYTFNGWYTAASGGSQISASTKMPNSNVTYYAHWTANTYTLTLNANGGNFGYNDYIRTKSVTYNNAYGTLDTPYRIGYTFIGWYTEPSIGFSSTYYADSYSDLKAAFGYNYDSLLNHWINNGMREGRISNYTYRNSSSIYKKTGNETLYAWYTPKSYTLTFNANGGTVSETSRTYKYDESIGLLPIPTRAGYNFAGWYGCPNGAFDHYYYSYTYSDLYAAFGENEGALKNHWLSYGLYEGRRSAYGNINCGTSYCETWAREYDMEVCAEWWPGGWNDTSAPTCTIVKTSTGSSGVSGYASCSDTGGSGCTGNPTFKNKKNDFTMTVYDQAGNKGTCKGTVTKTTTTKYRTYTCSGGGWSSVSGSCTYRTGSDSSCTGTGTIYTGSYSGTSGYRCHGNGTMSSTGNSQWTCSGSPQKYTSQTCDWGSWTTTKCSGDNCEKKTESTYK